jgi:hypothetical protein
MMKSAEITPLGTFALRNTVDAPLNRSEEGYNGKLCNSREQAELTAIDDTAFQLEVGELEDNIGERVDKLKDAVAKCSEGNIVGLKEDLKKLNRESLTAEERILYDQIEVSLGETGEAISILAQYICMTTQDCLGYLEDSELIKTYDRIREILWHQFSAKQFENVKGKIANLKKLSSSLQSSLEDKAAALKQSKPAVLQKARPVQSGWFSFFQGLGVVVAAAGVLVAAVGTFVAAPAVVIGVGCAAAVVGISGAGVASSYKSSRNDEIKEYDLADEKFKPTARAIAEAEKAAVGAGKIKKKAGQLQDLVDNVELRLPKVLTQLQICVMVSQLEDLRANALLLVETLFLAE